MVVQANDRGMAEAGTLNRRDRMYLAGPLSDRGQDGAEGKVVQEGTGRKSRVCFMLKMTQFFDLVAYTGSEAII